jgi:hypothetical protein
MRNSSDRSLRTFKHNSALSDFGECWTGKCSRIVLIFYAVVVYERWIESGEVKGGYMTLNIYLLLTGKRNRGKSRGYV